MKIAQQRRTNIALIVTLLLSLGLVAALIRPHALVSDARAQLPVIPDPVGRTTRVWVRVMAPAWGDGDWNGDGNVFEILSFQHGLSRSADRGRPVFDGFTLIKEVDRYTPRLAESVCKGQVISQLEIELTASYGLQAEPVTYLRYELKNVQVVNYDVRSRDTQGGRPVEEIGLVFEEIRVIHTDHDEGGLPGASTEFRWKVEKGE